MGPFWPLIVQAAGREVNLLVLVADSDTDTLGNRAGSIISGACCRHCYSLNCRVLAIESTGHFHCDKQVSSINPMSITTCGT